jgi:hypothetical protein
MTTQQQANEIILKYSKVLPSCCCFMDCVKCAITEVEAIIAENKANGVYEVFMEKWYGIIEHLKQML